MRRFLALACMVATGVLVLSPSATAQSVRAGVKGGLNIADIPELTNDFDQEGATNLRPRYGLIVGGFATIRMAGWAAFQPEVLYTQKGMHGRDPIGPNQGFEARVDYLDVPLLLRLQSSGGTGLYALAGPSLNFNLSAKLWDEGGGDDVEVDIADDIEDFEFGLVFGAGIQLGYLLLEGRWSEGLTNLATDPDPGDNAYKNRSFAFLVGLRFP